MEDLKSLVLAVFLTATFSAYPAQANLLNDTWGILTDPLKLGRSTSNAIHAIERAAIHAERIEGKINASVEARLTQIDKTVRETREALDKTATASLQKIDDITTKAFSEISILQRGVFLDTAQLVKCTTEVSLFQVQTKLAETLNDLGKRKPRLEIFGWVILSAKIEQSDIKSPIGSFREVKRLYDAKLTKITPNQHPTEITDSYGELQRIADLTRCHYKADTGLSIELYEYELEYNRLEKYWVGLVKLL